MRFYLKDFCIFISVAETGSLSKAATNMGLSISSVSKRLARLEDHLQTILFERNTRGVRLSPLGKVAYEKSKEITNIFSSFVNDIRGSSDLRLNIQVENSIKTIPFVEWIYDYAAISSNSLVNYGSATDIKKMPIDINDIFISPYKSTWPLAIHRRLDPIERKIFASSNFLGEVSLKSLESKNIVFYTNDKKEKPTIFNLTSGEELHLSPVMITSDLSQIINLCDTKSIIIIGLPSYFSKKYENKGLIREVLREWSLPSLQCFLIWKERRYYNNEFNDFLKLLESRFSSFIKD